MPRSIQEILDPGDELARRFEEYDPKAGDERVLEEYLLERATIERARSERQVVEAVVAARGKGLSWQRIGDISRDVGPGRPAALRHRRRRALSPA